MKKSSHDSEVQEKRWIMEYYFTMVLFISYEMADCTNGDVSAPMRAGRPVGTVPAGLL